MESSQDPQQIWSANSGSKRPSPMLLAGAAAAAILLVGLLVYLLIGLNRLDRQTASLDQRLERTIKMMETVVLSTEDAVAKATRAEQAAQLAAQGRAAAEQEAAEARDEALVARTETAIAKKEATEARDEVERIRQEREEELNRLQASLNRIAETRRTALGLVMNLGSDALQFDFDKAALRFENRELLSRILGILLTLEKGYGIYVYGHTDDVGSEQYNMDLSLRRAQAVRDYLVEGGINPKIVTTKGFGKSRPIAAGTSPEARAKNRRVEIGIIHTDIRYEAALPNQ